MSLSHLPKPLNLLACLSVVSVDCVPLPIINIYLLRKQRLVTVVHYASEVAILSLPACRTIEAQALSRQSISATLKGQPH